MVTDGILSVYPNVQFQQCCVHVSRNIAHKVRICDRQEICNDFKSVYQAGSKEEATSQINFMIDKWKKQYPRVVKPIMNPALLTFYNFPSSIRRTIYSTNLIEGFNKQLKKHKEKRTISNEESLERFLVSQFNNYNQKFLGRVHKGFKEIQDTLESMFLTYIMEGLVHLHIILDATGILLMSSFYIFRITNGFLMRIIVNQVLFF